MESGDYNFSKRIAIEGSPYSIEFKFYMLHGEYKKQYRVSTKIPACDFVMHLGNSLNKSAYIFKNWEAIPYWLRNDKNAEMKLSEAIVNVVNSNLPKGMTEPHMRHEAKIKPSV